MDRKKAHLSELMYQLQRREDALENLTSEGIQTLGPDGKPGGEWREQIPQTQESLREQIAQIKQDIEVTRKSP